MKIQTCSFYPYETALKTGQVRLGALVHITDQKGNSGWGDVAPLPNYSKETLAEALSELEEKKERIMQLQRVEDLTKLCLLPSSLFGVESAFFSLLDPLPAHSVQVSALLMGTCSEILEQAEHKKKEGYTSAKVKVSGLNFEEAFFTLEKLKKMFFLRVDVNRAWQTQDSLEFFSQFSLDSFDYVEEPFQNPCDLSLFTHPLAVDESFPRDLSLEEIGKLPKLKAVIYKPTIQGGMTGSQELYSWAKKNKISLVLSSSFESNIGLMHIASMAYRLHLTSPVGIGTIDFLQSFMGSFSLSRAVLQVPKKVAPRWEKSCN